MRSVGPSWLLCSGCFLVAMHSTATKQDWSQSVLLPMVQLLCGDWSSFSAVVVWIGASSPDGDSLSEQDGSLFWCFTNSVSQFPPMLSASYLFQL